MAVGLALLSKRPRLDLAATLLMVGILCSPQLAFAANVCEHPFSGGGECVQAFSVVSAVYAILATTYAFGALLIGYPRLAPGRFKLAVVLAPLGSWLGAMIGFSLGGMFGFLSYPHDSSPFFFLDWFTVLVTFFFATVIVVFLYMKKP